MNDKAKEMAMNDEANKISQSSQCLSYENKDELQYLSQVQQIILSGIQVAIILYKFSKHLPPLSELRNINSTWVLKSSPNWGNPGQSGATLLWEVSSRGISTPSLEKIFFS